MQAVVPIDATSMYKYEEKNTQYCRCLYTGTYITGLAQDWYSKY